MHFTFYLISLCYLFYFRDKLKLRLVFFTYRHITLPSEVVTRKDDVTDVTCVVVKLNCLWRVNIARHKALMRRYVGAYTIAFKLPFSIGDTINTLRPLYCFHSLVAKHVGCARFTLVYTACRGLLRSIKLFSNWTCLKEIWDSRSTDVKMGELRSSENTTILKGVTFRRRFSLNLSYFVAGLSNFSLAIIRN